MERNKILLGHSPSPYFSTFFDQLPNHRHLIEYVIEKIEIRYEDLADSNRLQKIMNRIIAFLLTYLEKKTGRRDRSTLNHASSVAFWGLHAMTVRLNLLKSVLIYQLCIPHLYQLLGMGTVEDRNNEARWSQPRAPSFSNMLERAKAIIIETFSLFLSSEEVSGLDEEKEEEINRRKTNLFYHLLEFKFCPLIPQIITIKEDGKYLLELLTCYTLSITAICDALKQSIRNVISSIIDVVSDSENRYPVDPTDKSRSLILQYHRYIFPIIYDYLQWCQTNADSLVRDSRKDEIMMSVNKALRTSLKSETYNGPQDILVLYYQKYRDRLTNIPLPLQPYTVKDIEQAKKDIKREKIVVNKLLYSATSSSSSSIASLNRGTSSATEGAPQMTAWAAMREEMKKVLIFLFAIDNPEILELSSVDLQCRTEAIESPPRPASLQFREESLDPKDGGDDSSAEDKTEREIGSTSVLSKENCEDYDPPALSPPLPRCDPHDAEEDEASDEEFGTFADSAVQSLKKVQHYNWDLIEAIKRHHYSTSSAVPTSPSRAMHNGDTSHQSANSEVIRRQSSEFSTTSSSNSITSIDDANSLLSKQLMKRRPRAGSQSSLRGAPHSPAAIVYGDLLELLHCHIVLAASRTIAAGDAFILLNDLYGGEDLIFCPSNRPRVSSSSSPLSVAQKPDESPAHSSDISVAVTTSAVKVVLKERYRLIASQALDVCRSMDDLVPLMWFECTTTTLLLLSPEAYLSAESLKPSSQDPSKTIVLEVNNFERAACLLNVLITDPDRVCKRAVTIEPYWEE